MIDLDEAKYKISEVARAVNLRPTTVRSWMERKILVLHDKDKSAESEGLPHALTKRTALKLGIVGELTEFGVSPKMAVPAAAAFTDEGDRGRLPGHLFGGDGTFTVLCIFPGPIYEVQKIVLGDKKQKATGPIELFKPTRHSRSDLAIFLILNTLHERVLTALEKKT